MNCRLKDKGDIEGDYIAEGEAGLDQAWVEPRSGPDQYRAESERYSSSVPG